MLRSALRIVAGYAAACLAAGATQVLFVVDPTGLFATCEATAAAGLLTAMAATQAATFALPFAAIAVLLTEWFRLRGWLTFVIAGGLVAVSGYLTVIAGEGGGLTPAQRLCGASLPRFGRDCWFCLLGASWTKRRSAVWPLWPSVVTSD